jgi:hypothetical protein
MRRPHIEDGPARSKDANVPEPVVSESRRRRAQRLAPTRATPDADARHGRCGRARHAQREH